MGFLRQGWWLRASILAVSGVHLAHTKTTAFGMELKLTLSPMELQVFVCRDNLEKLKTVFIHKPVCKSPPGEGGPAPALMCLLLAPYTEQKSQLA